MIRLLLLGCLLIPLALPGQTPSLERWLKTATEIKPGLWISNQEVSIRDYWIFGSYLLADSGEVMMMTFSPVPLGELEGVPKVYFAGNWGGKPSFFTRCPVEVDHPLAGISHFQARAYCIWLTQFCNGIRRYQTAQYDTARARKLPLVRFRLPSPEEWELAASQIKAPKKNSTYAEAPSRYLQTRTVHSSRKGERLLHFRDNVSEMTADPKVVMGGNYQGEGLEKTTFDGRDPDLRVGFRIVMEYLDPIPAGYKEPSTEPGLRKYENQIKYRDEVVKRDRTHELKDKFYPFDLEKRHFEVEPSVWMSKANLTVEEYAYYLFHIQRDSGEVYTREQFPEAFFPADGKRNFFHRWDSIQVRLPQDGKAPIPALSAAQLDRYCLWLTTFNHYLAAFPASPNRYWFRLPTQAELAKAQMANPAAFQSGPGIRIVVEVMPDHPDAKGFKRIPAYQNLDGSKYSWKKPIWKGYPHLE